MQPFNHKTWRSVRHTVPGHKMGNKIMNCPAFTERGLGGTNLAEEISKGYTLCAGISHT